MDNYEMELEVADAEYYAEMEYFERTYAVTCATCGKLDRLSQPQFERLGWTSDKHADFCPAHAETQFDATNGRDREYETWSAMVDRKFEIEIPF